MATSHYAKVQPGDVLNGLPGLAWNDMLDVVSAAKSGRLGSLAAPGLGALAGGVVPIRNDSGSSLLRFSILGITGFLIDPGDNETMFLNRPTLTGAAPQASDLERFVILQQPVRSGGICDGLLLGLTPVQIDVVNDTDDYADIVASDMDKLKSQPFGSCWIAYKQSGTGVKWALVVHGVQGSQFVLGKTASAINKGASGTVNVYRGTTAGSEASGGTTITAWNHFANVASGKWVLAVRVQRNWKLVAGEC